MHAGRGWSFCLHAFISCGTTPNPDLRRSPAGPDTGDLSLWLHLQGRKLGQCWRSWTGEGLQPLQRANALVGRLVWACCRFQLLYGIKPSSSTLGPVGPHVHSECTQWRSRGWTDEWSRSRLQEGEECLSRRWNPGTIQTLAIRVQTGCKGQEKNQWNLFQIPANGLDWSNWGCLQFIGYSFIDLDFN